MTRWWLDTRDKPAVLWAFLEHFIQDSTLIFRGSLADLDLVGFPGARVVLRPPGANPRRWPDVVELPVSASNIQALKKGLSRPNVFSVPGVFEEVELVHGGRCVFLAGDGFHRECVSAMPPTSESFLQSLVEKGAIRTYSRKPPVGGWRNMARTRSL